MPKTTRRKTLRLIGGALTCPTLLLPSFHQSIARGPTSGRIKIGQIGVGHAHATKLSVYRNSADYEVVCGTEGTFHLQPLDNPTARVALSQARGGYKKGYQDVVFSKFTRYVEDAADMARVIRNEKSSSFSYDHDMTVQRTLMNAGGIA